MTGILERLEDVGDGWGQLRVRDRCGCCGLRRVVDDNERRLRHQLFMRLLPLIPWTLDPATMIGAAFRAWGFTPRCWWPDETTCRAERMAADDAR